MICASRVKRPIATVVTRRRRYALTRVCITDIIGVEKGPTPDIWISFPIRVTRGAAISCCTKWSSRISRGTEMIWIPIYFIALRASPACAVIQVVAAVAIFNTTASAVYCCVQSHLPGRGISGLEPFCPSKRFKSFIDIIREK